MKDLLVDSMRGVITYNVTGTIEEESRSYLSEIDLFAIFEDRFPGKSTRVKKIYDFYKSHGFIFNELEVNSTELQEDEANYFFLTGYFEIGDCYLKAMIAHTDEESELLHYLITPFLEDNNVFEDWDYFAPGFSNSDARFSLEFPLSLVSLIINSLKGKFTEINSEDWSDKMKALKKEIGLDE